jgi:hypothetical protein
MPESEIRRTPVAGVPRRTVSEALEYRQSTLMARLMRAQASTRANIRRRVGAGETIPMNEIEGARRSLGILYSQHEVALRELTEYQEKQKRKLSE